ncbi:MAG: hypothetical protein ACAI25_10125 [Planctomycetota bacterium]
MATTTNYFDYDLSQRMTKLWSKDTSDATYFVFNQRRKLTEMRRLPVGGDTVRTFAYNGLGERCVVVDGGSPLYWTYDRGKLLVEQQTTGTARRRYRHNRLPMPNLRLGRTLEVNDSFYGNHNAVTDQSGNHLRLQSDLGFDVNERTIYGEVKDQSHFIQDECERQTLQDFCSPLATSRECQLKTNGGACLQDQACDLETGTTDFCLDAACTELDSPIDSDAFFSEPGDLINCGEHEVYKGLELQFNAQANAIKASDPSFTTPGHFEAYIQYTMLGAEYGAFARDIEEWAAEMETWAPFIAAEKAKWAIVPELLPDLFQPSPYGSVATVDWRGTQVAYDALLAATANAGGTSTAGGAFASASAYLKDFVVGQAFASASYISTRIFHHNTDVLGWSSSFLGNAGVDILWSGKCTDWADAVSGALKDMQAQGFLNPKLEIYHVTINNQAANGEPTGLLNPAYGANGTAWYTPHEAVVVWLGDTGVQSGVVLDPWLNHGAPEPYATWITNLAPGSTPAILK